MVDFIDIQICWIFLSFININWH